MTLPTVLFSNALLEQFSVSGSFLDSRSPMILESFETQVLDESKNIRVFHAGRNIRVSFPVDPTLPPLRGEARNASPNESHVGSPPARVFLVQGHIHFASINDAVFSDFELVSASTAPYDTRGYIERYFQTSYKDAIRTPLIFAVDVRPSHSSHQSSQKAHQEGTRDAESPIVIRVGHCTGYSRSSCTLFLCVQTTPDGPIHVSEGFRTSRRKPPKIHGLPRICFDSFFKQLERTVRTNVESISSVAQPFFFTPSLNAGKRSRDDHDDDHDDHELNCDPLIEHRKAPIVDRTQVHSRKTNQRPRRASYGPNTSSRNASRPSTSHHRGRSQPSSPLRDRNHSLSPSSLSSTEASTNDADGSRTLLFFSKMIDSSIRPSHAAESEVYPLADMSSSDQPSISASTSFSSISSRSALLTTDDNLSSLCSALDVNSSTSRPHQQVSDFELDPDRDRSCEMKEEVRTAKRHKRFGCSVELPSCAELFAAVDSFEGDSSAKPFSSFPTSSIDRLAEVCKGLSSSGSGMRKVSSTTSLTSLDSFLDRVEELRVESPQKDTYSVSHRPGAAPSFSSSTPSGLMLKPFPSSHSSHALNPVFAPCFASSSAYSSDNYLYPLRRGDSMIACSSVRPLSSSYSFVPSLASSPFTSSCVQKKSIYGTNSLECASPVSTFSPASTFPWNATSSSSSIPPMMTMSSDAPAIFALFQMHLQRLSRKSSSTYMQDSCSGSFLPS